MTQAPELRDPIPAEEETPRPQARRVGALVWREWIRPFILILIVMGTFRSAIADWNHVPTGSMKPTILVGDRIFVNKLAYDLKVPVHPHPAGLLVESNRRAATSSSSSHPRMASGW